MNTFSVKDKIMVITGGTNGIGRGLVDYFVEQEAVVIASDHANMASGSVLVIDGGWTTV